MQRFSPSFRHLAATCALSALLAAPAAADPTVGIGFTISFGGGTTQTGVGIRIFSDNEEDSTVGSVGLDYLFNSGNWRGTLGAAYLGNNSYIGLDLGIGLGNGNLDFGLGGGLVNTDPPPAAVAPPPPPPPPPQPGPVQTPL